jgi:Sortase domain
MTLTPLSWRLAAGAVVALIATAVIGLVTVSGDDSAPNRVADARPTPVAAATTPTAEPPTPTADPPTTTIRPTAPAPKLAAETVSIPAQHVVAPIDVCQIINGGLEPPANVHRTCYWAGGSHVTASAGTTVITGHINYVGQGTGALGNIDELHQGDTVFTSGEHGQVTRWTVATVTHRPKTTGINPAAFVGPGGARKLYLITCGGAFDASDSSYVDNIYVQAVPATAPPSPAAHPLPGSRPA